jgi:hypothetical protein
MKTVQAAGRRSLKGSDAAASLQGCPLAWRQIDLREIDLREIQEMSGSKRTARYLFFPGISDFIRLIQVGAETVATTGFAGATGVESAAGSCFAGKSTEPVAGFALPGGVGAGAWPAPTPAEARAGFAPGRAAAFAHCTISEILRLDGSSGLDGTRSI